MELAHALSSVHWPAVVTAAVSTFLIGGLWYSPLLFAKPWMALNGTSEQELQSGNAAFIFGGSFILALCAALGLALFLGSTATLEFGAAAGFLAGTLWVATSLGTTFLFERRPLRLLAIDASYHVVTFTLMGTILGAWH
ncbi:MAG: DUF1761 domain-containing protein [Chloroflexota bacterium]